jgi:Do/DeqQ family serine protease
VSARPALAPASLALAALALGIGLGVGLRVGARLEPRALAAPGAGPTADFSAIARRATPAVVNISALQVFRKRSPFFSDPFDFFGQSPWREQRKTSLGSGVLVSQDGYVVTNNHVIEHASQILVTTSAEERLPGRLVGRDPVTDIALLKIEGTGRFPSLAWGDSSRVAVGEYVLAIGNPFQLNQSVTMGIISAVGRSNVGIVDYEDFIQTDAAINPGNSGGALVDTRGSLIGINTAIYSETGGYQGIGFAVPANLARSVSGQIIAHGRVRRGWVGITQIRDLDDASARELGLQEGAGAVVWQLLRGSPADRAGVEPGDVVVAVNGSSIQSAGQLRNAIAAAEVGSELVLTVLRGGRRQQLRLPVEELRNRD